MALHFKQSCPVCGRRLEVPTRLLGLTIACQHCCAEFCAGMDADDSSGGNAADQLLARVDAALSRSRAPAIERMALSGGGSLSVSPTMGPSH